VADPYKATLNPPYIKSSSKKVWTVKAGDAVSTELEVINPADYISASASTGSSVTLTHGELPKGSEFDGKTFTWTIGEDVAEGVYHATFTLDDGVIPVKQVVTVNVTKEKSNGGGGSSGCDTGAAFLVLGAAGVAYWVGRKK
jgi:hypothetical protein